MRDNTRQQWLDSTLAFVNEIRVSLGGAPLDRLPPGARRDSHRCPIANAFSDAALPSAGVASLFLYRVGCPPLRYWYPRDVRLFRGMFDSGGYPELIKP